MADSEVVPQPRLDVRVLPHVGDGAIRHTEYRGTVWFGGRPQARGGMVVSRGGAMAPTGDRMWLPDSLVYRTEAAAGATVAASAALQSARGEAQVLDVRAELAPHPEHPELSYVLLTIAAAGQLPVGVAYSVGVAVDAGAVAD